MRIFLQCALIAGLTATAALAVYYFHPNRPPLYLDPRQVAQGEVELAEVLKWVSEGEVVWIDARPRRKYEQGHLEGAFLLNEQDDFNALLLPIYAELANRADRPFVVYCGSDLCAASRRVAGLLRDRVGVADVFVLKGGTRVLRDLGMLP
ncbi:MAG: rhodanese-like domain-containing protein [Verrucomicrobiales bacterium]